MNDKIMESALSRLEPCSCPRCDSGQSLVTIRSPDRQFDSPGIFCVSRCKGCGLLFQNPRIPLALLLRHYPTEYAPYGSAELSLDHATQCHLKNSQGYHHLECDIQPTAIQRRHGKASSGFHLIPDYSPGGKVFEIGCAAGNRLALLSRLGWQTCLGNEYSAGACGESTGAWL